VPPQQFQRLLDLGGQGLDLGAHGIFLSENDVAGF
jgi:hypothetical protein